MEIYFTAVGIILLGALLQSSSYVPLSMVRDWSWESFSFIRGIIIYMVCPMWAAVHLALPSGYLFYEMFDEIPIFQLVATIAAGLVWGATELMYERSMFYLGASRGKALSSLMTALFGMGLAVLVMHTFFYHKYPEWELSASAVAGTLIAFAGYFFLGQAGDRKNKEIQSSQDADRRQFDWKRGLIFALSGGIMGACLNVAMVTGDGIFLPETIVAYRWLPALFLFCIGAFISNTVICIVQNIRNDSFYEYSQPEVWKMNLLLCVVTGLTEFAALFGFTVGRALFKETALSIYAFVIFLVCQTFCSHLWEMIVGEWQGISRTTRRYLGIAAVLLVLSIIVPVIWMLV